VEGSDARCLNSAGAKTRHRGQLNLTVLALALDLLAGRAFNGSNLVYARMGAGWLDRSALYRTAGDTSAYDEWDVAYRFGAGVETPVGHEIAVRLEAIVASYEDFELTAGDEPDRFAGASVETSMSLVYRPGQGAAGDSAVSHDFAGFYAGAGFGVGTSETRVTGPRQAGSVLDADFGGAGGEGAVFVGYGGVWDRFYLGIEASLDAGTTAWRHVREDEGRVFAVERTYAWSISARVGYIVPNSALFYLKAGLRSQALSTEYESGAGFFDQEEQLTGFAFGPGIEMALNDRAFVRAEYLFADLGGYTVTYGANADRFAGNEMSLTTISIGIRL
jgi:opacity protein-like surface antigen